MLLHGNLMCRRQADKLTAYIRENCGGFSSGLQKAIEVLARNRIILMIAHRLKIVRSAERIPALDGGKIVQQGRYEELIGLPGMCADFIGGRQETESWKL